MLALVRRWTIVFTIGIAACRRAPAPVVQAVDAAADVEPPRGRWISIAYSSNDEGEYERCGCPVHPLGGLARRAAEIDKARAEADGVLVVDAGDLFSSREKKKGWAPAAGEVERRARLLAAAYGRIGVHAFTPGELDLAIGVERLKKVLAEAKVPVVSANLVDRAGKPLWEADRIVDVAGVKIGVFGVTAPTPFDAERLRALGVVAKDAAAAARGEATALRARGARLVVALVHGGGRPEIEAALAAAPGIDWAVLGHTGRNLEDPERLPSREDGVLMLEAQSGGKHLGRLDLHIVQDGVDGAFVSRGRAAQLRTILADFGKQVAEYEDRLAKTQGQPKLLEYYEGRVAELNKAIARDTAALAALPPRITGNWFENRIIPLDDGVPGQPGVALLVAAYDEESTRLAAKGRPVGIKPVGAEPPAPPHEPGETATPSASYVGNDACNRCHPNAVAVWAKTKHARAMATLEHEGRARSPECVPCHVTGYLRAGGTTDLATATAKFPNVGCEACHGPGSTHVEAVSKRDTIARRVPATVCLGCHTPDQTDDGFSYEKFLPSVLALGHGK
jgi:hypothetical protein